LTFYEGSQFPSEYRGDLFAAEHGSWNRSTRTGYEVIRVPLDGGHASGAFEDFLTGFVTADGKVLGQAGGRGGGSGRRFVGHRRWFKVYLARQLRQ
jgi:glucose/arabinose dehydrogenase